MLLIHLTMGFKRVIMRLNHEGGESMNDKETKILTTISILLPKMTESEKMYLLGQAEGMALMKKKQTEDTENNKSGETEESSKELQEV